MAFERGRIWLLVFSVWLMSVQCEGNIQFACSAVLRRGAKLIYLLFKDYKIFRHLQHRRLCYLLLLLFKLKNRFCNCSLIVSIKQLSTNFLSLISLRTVYRRSLELPCSLLLSDQLNNIVLALRRYP